MRCLRLPCPLPTRPPAQAAFALPPTPPGACSSAVAALLSLLAPFPYSLDWRPYFTIHDAAFARLAAGETPKAANGLPMLLGLTNLYFLKVRGKPAVASPLPACATGLKSRRVRWSQRPSLP